MPTFDTKDLQSSSRSDDFTEVREQNLKLAKHLQSDWSDLRIVFVERIERANPESAKRGWRAWYAA